MIGRTFAERLELAIAGFESVHAFSKKAEISDTMLRKYLDGSMPGLDKLIKIADTANVTLDWLAADRGPMRHNDLQVTDSEGNTRYAQIKSARSASWEELKGSDDYALVRRLDVAASAGTGLVNELEDPLDFLAFQKRWLRDRGIKPEFARILTARGDSMLETIGDGDTLLVDTSINHFKDNAIYVLMYGNMLLVKRIHARLNGSVQLISDNPRYAPEEVTAGEVEDLRVAGRVMWFGRSI